MGISQPGPGYGYAHEYTIRLDGSRGPSNLHPLVFIEENGFSAWVDEGIADDIRLLWKAGIETFSSCQGDENYSRFIQLAKHADLPRASGLRDWLSQFDWVIEIDPHPPILRGHYDDVCRPTIPNPPAAIWAGLL